MKRLLVLMLVLGFASMATAGLQIWINGAVAEDSSITLAPSDTVWIGVYSDGTVNGGKHSGALIITSGPGSWTGATTNTSGLAESYVIAPGGPLGIFVQTNAAPGDTLGAGVWSEFEFHCDDLGSVTFLLVDDLYGPQDTLTIHQIPEPVTMALLGLGGLFLRRRK